MPLLADTKDKSRPVNIHEMSVSSFVHLIKPDVLSLLGRLSAFLDREGNTAYLVGGFVRDTLLTRESGDIDIAVAGDALDIAQHATDYLGGRYVPLDPVNRIGRVIFNDGSHPLEIDFSSFSGGIENDLANRDFTIDALAINLSEIFTAGATISIIDPFGGLNDLRHGVVRAVSETIFCADAARLLRGVRLAAELGFEIDPNTEDLISKYAPLITTVAGERLREELLHLLALSRAGGHLAHLDRLGLLTAIIPELAPARGAEQPKEHHWDVMEHSLRTVTALSFLLRQGDWEYGGDEALALVPWGTRLAEHFRLPVSSGSTRASLLKLAALLHDVAKPETRIIEADGRMRFLGHPQMGAERATEILGRLKFSNKEIRLVATLIEHHLRPTQMSQTGLPTPRAIYRYFRDTGEAGVDILFLSLADHLATRGPTLDRENWRVHTQIVHFVLDRHFAAASPAAARLITGHDLMNIFGLEPGPIIKRLLEAVQEAQASGEITSREAAIAYVKLLMRDSADDETR
jgi:poly(A) polymerase